VVRFFDITTRNFPLPPAFAGIPVGRLLASDDGVNFRPLVLLPGTQGYRGGTVRTFAFPETNAR
jgi:hypothetical protein